MVPIIAMMKYFHHPEWICCYSGRIKTKNLDLKKQFWASSIAKIYHVQNCCDSKFLVSQQLFISRIMPSLAVIPGNWYRKECRCLSFLVLV
jgi:hypothetical protein